MYGAAQKFIYIWNSRSFFLFLFLSHSLAFACLFTHSFSLNMLSSTLLIDVYRFFFRSFSLAHLFHSIWPSYIWNPTTTIFYIIFFSFFSRLKFTFSKHTFESRETKKNAQFFCSMWNGEDSLNIEEEKKMCRQTNFRLPPPPSPLTQPHEAKKIVRLWFMHSFDEGKINDFKCETNFIYFIQLQWKIRRCGHIEHAFWWRK